MSGAAAGRAWGAAERAAQLAMKVRRVIEGMAAFSIARRLRQRYHQT
jgi:hypothetical protein